MKNAPGNPAKGTFTRLSLMAVAGLLAAVAPAVPAQAAAPAPGSVHSGRISSLCERYQHFVVVTAQGAHFVVKNDNYGGQQECLAIQGERPNFRVTTGPRNAAGSSRPGGWRTSRPGSSCGRAASGWPPTGSGPGPNLDLFAGREGGVIRCWCAGPDGDSGRWSLTPAAPLGKTNR